MIIKLGGIMKRLITFTLLVLFTGVTILSALTLDDLDIPDRMTVEEYLIENIEDITTITIDELGDDDYNILAVGEKYVIIEVDGVIFIIEKE